MRNQTVVSAAVGVILSSLTACGGSPPPPAPAPPAAPVVVAYKADIKAVSGKNQWIHTANPGLCLDVKGDNASQHAVVRAWGCHNNEGQKWAFGPGTGGAVQVGGVGGLCLTQMSAPGPDGSLLELLTCNGTPAQQFRFYVDGRIQEATGGRCLAPASPAPGAGIVPTACDVANGGQVWAVAAN